MTCDLYRDAISAIVDGEEPGIERRLVDAHLRVCRDCQQFRVIAESTRRVGAIGVAPEMPDLSRRVTKLAALADRASTWSTVRAVLAVVAIEILVFSLPSLTARDESGTSAHDARHLGAFTVAYAVALLVVVVRPAHARAVLPVACTLAVALLITATVDLVNGNIPLVQEALHIPEILSVALVWAIARPARRRPPTSTTLAPSRLSVVESEDRQTG